MARPIDVLWGMALTAVPSLKWTAKWTASGLHLEADFAGATIRTSAARVCMDGVVAPVEFRRRIRLESVDAWATQQIEEVNE